jgi:hypothetical protein
MNKYFMAKPIMKILIMAKKILKSYGKINHN